MFQEFCVCALRTGSYSLATPGSEKGAPSVLFIRAAHSGEERLHHRGGGLLLRRVAVVRAAARRRIRPPQPEVHAIEPVHRVERADQPLVRPCLREQVDAVGGGGAVLRVELPVVQTADPGVVAALVADFRARDRLAAQLALRTTTSVVRLWGESQTELLHSRRWPSWRRSVASRPQCPPRSPRPTSARAS